MFRFDIYITLILNVYLLYIESVYIYIYIYIYILNNHSTQIKIHLSVTHYE